MGLLAPEPPVLITRSHLLAWPDEGGKGGWVRARAVLNDPPGPNLKLAADEWLRLAPGGG